MAPRDDRDDVPGFEFEFEGVRGAPPGELPGRLCAAAVRLLPVTGASVSLRVDGMPVGLSASDEAAARVAEVQETVGDGPGREAVAVGAPVLASDLTRGADARRWPVFARQAVAAGARAVYSLPLGDDAVCVGTLDLYRDTPGELTGRDLRTARLVAGVMTMALMVLHGGLGGDGALPGGDGALPGGGEALPGGGEALPGGLTTDHGEVSQATGMIMVQLGVTADDALARLRAHAFAHGRTAADVARDVLAHRTRFDR
nr:GAF and ANTAR domain-containing protein [Streptomyces spongiae]